MAGAPPPDDPRDGGVAVGTTRWVGVGLARWGTATVGGTAEAGFSGAGASVTVVDGVEGAGEWLGAGDELGDPLTGLAFTPEPAELLLKSTRPVGTAKL